MAVAFQQINYFYRIIRGEIFLKALETIEEGFLVLIKLNQFRHHLKLYFNDPG